MDLDLLIIKDEKMKITTIYINNFRLLKDFKLDLDDELSLVIGKNNTGKTSILTVLEKFINSEKNKFTSEDFNLKFKNQIKDLIENKTPISEPEFDSLGKNLGIKLRLLIEYDEEDDLSNLSSVMMNLEPDNNIVVLGYDFVINYERYLNCRRDFVAYKIKEQSKQIIKQKLVDEIREKTESTKEETIETVSEVVSEEQTIGTEEIKESDEEVTELIQDVIEAVDAETKELENGYEPRGFNEFFKKYFLEYFKLYKGPLDWNDKNKCVVEKTIVDKENFSSIINFKFIKAKRDVNNKDTDKTLSRQTSEIYKKEETTEVNEEKIEKFKDELTNTDRTLTKIYKDIFENIIDDVRMFGGLKKDETNIQIFSTLQDRELLEGNTTVMYTHDIIDKLPEHYNGLGYMNLISLIFEVKIQVEDFKKVKEEKPSDINLLFIEEPEAHTHPQMQYIFIKNIKKLLSGGVVKKLKNDEKKVIEMKRKLQYIVSTHSSHIVAESNYDDIKYLKKQSDSSVISKNLSDLKKEYSGPEEKQHYRFLKQYLTLNRAELFFTDKAIFIEGDTERILLPAMMKKMDYDDEENKLLSQNISIVEVGAYSQIFEKFIDFIGMKSLIITDIDSYYLAPKIKDGVPVIKGGVPELKVEKCPANHPSAGKTSNSSLHFFHAKTREDLHYFKELSLESKILAKDDGMNWNVNKEGNLLIVFQTEELDYHARSFEDAFFNINKKFICDEGNSFKSLVPKWLNKFKENENCFELSENGVASKPSLAIEILMNSIPDKGVEYSNWEIPEYIKQGLVWLKE